MLNDMVQARGGGDHVGRKEALALGLRRQALG